MVLLTIVTPSNPQTVYFDHDIANPNYIRLLSASMYNSWYNLEENGIVSVKQAGNSNAGPAYVIITAGYYTPESMAKTITERFAKENVDLTVNTRTSLDVMNILNPKNKYIFSLSNNLKALFGVVSQVNSNILVKKFNSKDAYFIHCDLIDREQNLLNGKPSSILTRLDVIGTSYEKITYQTAQQHVLRDTSTGGYVNSLTISVRDVDGNLFISLIRMRSKRDIKMGRLCTPGGAVLGIVGGGCDVSFFKW